MLKLYGFPVSNYYNMVKLALLEKGFEFEEVVVRPNQEEAFLKQSPMGKVPCLEADEGFISETSVILEFLEDISPGIALFPEDSFKRAKTRELMKATELYLELVGRQLFRSAFFGAPLSEELRDKVAPELDKGIAALNRLLVFGPYAAGDSLTYADLMLYYTVTLVGWAVKKVYGRDINSEMPGLNEWLQLMNQNAMVKQVNQDRDEAMQGFAAAR